MNNCKINLKKIHKIPQNNKSFFIIQKNKNWNNCIEIKFNLEEDIDYLNLYFILKSYILNYINPVYAIAICYIDINNKLIIAQKEYNVFIKKMSYISFIEWINYRVNNDWKYEKSENFMSILLMFDKNLTILNNSKYKTDTLKLFVPIYPWTQKWYNFFENNIDEVEILKNQNINNLNKIKILENENNDLENKNNDLENKIKEITKK